MNTEENKTGSVSSVPPIDQPRGNSGYLFFTPELNQRLDLLRHLVVNSDRIPLVKGLAGSGKTTLLERLQQMTFADWRHCRIDANSMLQPDQLYARLGECFEVPAGSASSTDALLQRCGERVAEGCIPVVLVDDAHLLPPSTLEALLGLYHTPHGGGVNLRVLLFALPKIEDRIRASRFQAAARQTLQALDLLPMNREQTEQMVEQMLRAAGLSDPVDVTTAQLDRIFRESRGLPGEIEKWVEAFQQRGVTRRSTGFRSIRLPIFSDLSGPSLVGGIIVVLLALGTLVFQDEVNELFTGSSPEAESLPVQEIDNRAVVPLQRPGPGFPASHDTPSNGEEVPEALAVRLPDLSGDPEPEVPGAGTGGRAAIAEKPEALPESAIFEEIPNSTIDSDASAQADADADPAQQPARTQEDGPGPVHLAALSEAPGVSVDAAVAASGSAQEGSGQSKASAFSPSEGQDAVSSNDFASASDPSKSEHLKPVSGEEGSVEKAPSGIPATEGKKITIVEDTSVAVVPPVLNDGVYREKWLLQQRPEKFTLQLIGVGDAEGVQRFLRSRQFGGDVAYFQTLRDGNPWFIVVTGIYPSRGAAVAARDRLPEKLRRNGAWPRTLGSVHEAIRVR